VAFLLKELTDQNIVLVHLQCDNRAGKNLAPSVDLEDGLESTELAVHNQMRISIAYFSGGQRQGSHILVLLLLLSKEERKIKR
jgi:ABC-type uncharacterized transport system ATPase component